MLYNITLETKTFSYTTNMNHAEMRIEFTFKRHIYVNRGKLNSKYEILMQQKFGLGIW